MNFSVANQQASGLHSRPSNVHTTLALMSALSFAGNCDTKPSSSHAKAKKGGHCSPNKGSVKQLTSVSNPEQGANARKDKFNAGQTRNTGTVKQPMTQNASGAGRKASITALENLNQQQRCILNYVHARNHKTGSIDVCSALLKNVPAGNHSAKREELSQALNNFESLKEVLRNEGLSNKQIDKMHQDLVRAHTKSIESEKRKLATNEHSGLTDFGTFEPEGEHVSGGVNAARPVKQRSKIAPVRSDIPRAERLEAARIFTQTARNTDSALSQLELRKFAHAYAVKFLTSINLGHLDPDTIHFNRFSSAQSDPYAYTGWAHTGEPVSTCTLTELTMMNVQPNEYQYNVLSSMNINAGCYTENNSTTGYGAHNELTILPSDIGNYLYKNDVATAYKAANTGFWRDHGDAYIKTFKAATIYAADSAYANGNLSSEGYNLAMSVMVPGLRHEESYLGEYRPALSMANLEGLSPCDGKVSKLDIYGYPSNMLIFSNPEESKSSDTHLLLSPISQTFHEFSSKTELNEWIINQCRTSEGLESLLKHWTTYLKSDGKTYCGVRTALTQMGKGDSDWLPAGEKKYRYINSNEEHISGDLFSHIAAQAQQDQMSEADSAINSGSRISEENFLNDLVAVERVLTPLAPLSPVVAAGGAIAGGIMTGVGVHLIASGRTPEEKDHGIMMTIQGVVNGLFTGFNEPPVSDDMSAFEGLSPARDSASLGGEYEVVAGEPASLEREIDITNAKPVMAGASSTANGASMLSVEGKGNVFVKQSVANLAYWNEKGEMVYEGPPTAEEQEFYAWRETCSTRQVDLLIPFKGGVPSSSVAFRAATSEEGIVTREYFVATEAIPGYQEVDQLFVNRDYIEAKLAEQGKSLETMPELEGKMDRLRQVQERIEAIKKETPEWYALPGGELKTLVSETRELRGYIFNELPLRDRIQHGELVMVDQITGGSDEANVWGQNKGAYKLPSGEWQNTDIDKGASLDVGFWGTNKNVDQYYTAMGQRPGVVKPEGVPAGRGLYTEESAQYGAQLPPLGTDLSNYPYPEDVQIFTSAMEDAAVRGESLKKIALMSIIGEGKGGADSVFTRNLEQLTNPPSQRLISKGFQPKEVIIATDQARRDALVAQAGGKDAVIRWARENPEISQELEALSKSYRAIYGLR